MIKYHPGEVESMSKFLDAHLDMKNIDEKTLKKLVNSPRDEFGVLHVNMLYNKAENKVFCMLDAPNREAVEKHHIKLGQKCDWIMEVEGAKILE